jgi:hypothetical protein
VVTQRLAIQRLGEFRVSLGAKVIDEREWTSRPARHLVKLLWPHIGPEDGATNLHKALYVARHILEPDLLRARITRPQGRCRRHRHDSTTSKSPVQPNSANSVLCAWNR